MNKQIFLLLTAALLAACTTESNPIDSGLNENIKQEYNVITSVILSDPAKDPYSVENMTLALKKTVLAKSRTMADSALAEDLSLEPNFLYVRFLAERGRGEYELKKYDTNLVLFKHPMDYKPIPKPAIYIDSTLPDSIVPYFATVPVDYNFGPTKYEVIKRLFLVEPDVCDDDCEGEESALSAKTLMKKKSGFAEETASKLSEMGLSLLDVERMSLEMTGNLQSRLTNDGAAVAMKVAPSDVVLGTAKKMGGLLMYHDSTLGYALPLVGARVTGGYSYYWREAHTGADGSFSIPEKWSYSIDYELNFDSDQFLLEDGHSPYGEDLEIEHNNTRNPWNETFYGNHAKWCLIWSAAYQYWYGNNFNLQRPRQNTLINWSMDIEVYYKEGRESDYYNENGSNTIGEYSIWLSAEDIGILAIGQSFSTIYGSTIHEIAHTSHYWNMNTTNILPQSEEFSQLSATFRDTYARGIENVFLGARYGDSYKRRDYNYQYTGLVEDLMGTNSSSNCKENSVYGFSVVDIEESFFQSKTFNAQKNYLKTHNASGQNGAHYNNYDLDSIYDCWRL